MGEIRGSRAVVIGGSQGMGLAMARALVAGGAEVVVTGRDEKRLEEARAVLGPSAHVVRSDVTSAADCWAGASTPCSSTRATPAWGPSRR
jgi:NAD(P)-dependent dehydrogenase (short-subunit alcohol dehydrogenase family)